MVDLYLSMSKDTQNSDVYMQGNIQRYISDRLASLKIVENFEDLLYTIYETDQASHQEVKTNGILLRVASKIKLALDKESIRGESFCSTKWAYLFTAYKFGKQRVKIPQMSSENLIVHEGHAFKHLQEQK